MGYSIVQIPETMFAVMMYLKKHYLRAKSNNDIEQMAGVNISVFPKTATKNCFVNLETDERENIETMLTMTYLQIT